MASGYFYGSHAGCAMSLWIVAIAFFVSSERTLGTHFELSSVTERPTHREVTRNLRPAGSAGEYAARAREREDTMKTSLGLGMGMLAGALVGAGGLTALQAQTKAPVYAIVDISEVTDPEGFKAIGQRTNEAAAAEFKELGGRYLARTSEIKAIDGVPPQRYVIISFDSMDKAKAWNESPSQAEVNAVRNKTTKSRVFFVQGM